MDLARTVNTIKYGRVFNAYFEQSAFVKYAVGFGVVLTICTASFIYGLISWKILRKFRTFQNFVYLNTVLVNTLRALSIFVGIVLYPGDTYTGV